VLVAIGAIGPRRAPSAVPAPAGTAPPAAPAPPAPVRLQGRIDTPLSRGLWLLKWLLAVPHLVVLAVLWLALAVTTVVSGFAILFTGRYPRPLFDYAVGVLRWSWRVGFYAFSALGTDRYPPFTLGAAPDYPATLEIDYPERLSRGLVTVKWWLLALPHYVILGLLAGGAATTGDRWWGSASAGGGLLAVLVVIAAVILLFTARYPQGLFDLLMGINRWVFRVVAYAGLLRDDYPPFRLDQGGTDTGTPWWPPSDGITTEADGSA
jgi:hypothetical protein